MADNEKGKSSSDNDLQPTVDRGSLKYLGGTEGLLDNQTHVGVSVHVTSAGGTMSSLVISKVNNISDKTPVFITNPVKLDLSNLEKFLTDHDIPMPDPVKNVLKGTSISCDAFYYTGKDGPLLMMFALDFDAKKEEEDKTKNNQEEVKGGLIARLSGSQELGQLFDVAGVSLRVLRCGDKHFKRIKDYCTALSG